MFRLSPAFKLCLMRPASRHCRFHFRPFARMRTPLDSALAEIERMPLPACSLVLVDGTWLNTEARCTNICVRFAANQKLLVDY